MTCGRAEIKWWVCPDVLWSFSQFQYFWSQQPFGPASGVGNGRHHFVVIIILLSLRPVLIVVDREKCYTRSPTVWSATGLKLLFNIYRTPLGDVIYQFGVKISSVYIESLERNQSAQMKKQSIMFRHLSCIISSASSCSSEGSRDPNYSYISSLGSLMCLCADRHSDILGIWSSAPWSSSPCSCFPLSTLWCHEVQWGQNCVLFPSFIPGITSSIQESHLTPGPPCHFLSLPCFPLGYFFNFLVWCRSQWFFPFNYESGLTLLSFLESATIG